MMTMYKFKNFIESSFETLNISKDWEAMRYKNMQDYNLVTVLGNCKSCHKAYPFQIDTLEFLSKGKASKFGSMEIIVHLEMECPYGGKKGVVVSLTHKHSLFIKHK